MRDSQYLSLADWRRSVGELYARIRAEKDPYRAWLDFRGTRDTLLKHHAQSPLAVHQRDAFENLHYFPYNPELRQVGLLKTVAKPKTYSVDLPVEGMLRLKQIGTIYFNLTGVPACLILYWIEGYGGGLFLPFRDATNGHDTYGGGRYLYDGIKGADLGARSDNFLLDFNFAYNPSCAYNDRWICPLAPAENWLPIEVRAGEMIFV